MIDDSGEEATTIKHRRNKKIVRDVNYDPKEVHATTRWRWMKKLNNHLKGKLRNW